MSINGYFAASNSGNGFRSYFKEVFTNADILYIIKGGPGTGKSRFMDYIGEYAERRGWKRENYFCSSDPYSLDGVILKKDGRTIALTDGTSPHTADAVIPGARDRFIDLGSFFKLDELEKKREEIIRLNREKSQLWRKAYLWLSGCLDMSCVISDIGRRLLPEHKADETAERLMPLCSGNSYSESIKICSSVGMMGSVTSCEYFNKSEKTVFIKDYAQTSDIVIRKIIGRCRLKKLDISVSYDPIDPDIADGVFIEDSKLFVTSCPPPDEADETIEMINLCENVNYKDSSELDHAHKCYDSMLLGATNTLCEVKNIHFELERIYGDAMDFAEKEKYTEKFCSELFG